MRRTLKTKNNSPALVEERRTCTKQIASDRKPQARQPRLGAMRAMHARLQSTSMSASSSSPNLPRAGGPKATSLAPPCARPCSLEHLEPICYVSRDSVAARWAHTNTPHGTREILLLCVPTVPFLRHRFAWGSVTVLPRFRSCFRRPAGADEGVTSVLSMISARRASALCSRLVSFRVDAFSRLVLLHPRGRSACNSFATRECIVFLVWIVHTGKLV